MPVFLADMVAKGFWWVWLAYLIIGIPLGVLVMIFQKINKILGIIGIVIQYTVTVYSQWGLIPRPLGRLELVNTHEKW